MSDRRQSAGRRWADAIDATRHQNCETCHLNDRCPDPRKARRFACALWIEKGDDPSSRDFLDMMRDLVRRESVVPDKFSIDDRAAPLAANSYEWNVGEQFLNFQPSPYPKQLELSLRLFLDMCSFCRGSWYDDIPFDCDVREIPEHVMLRRFGVCPRCHKSRLDGIRAGREVDYTSMVAIIGQRCVTGDTLLLTTRGITRMEDWSPPLRRPGWTRSVRLRARRESAVESSEMQVSLETGSRSPATRFWTSLPEHVFRMTTREGLTVRGTADHPLRVVDGWRNLGTLRPGTVIPIHFGQRLWGMRADVTPDQATLLGFWVSEGSGSRSRVVISNYDQDVLQFCREQMKTLSPGADVLLRRMRNPDRAEPFETIYSNDETLVHAMDHLVDGLQNRSAQKVIPRVVLEAPEETVCAFLQGLFEGDGWVSRRGSIGYSSISRDLIDHLRVVLLNLGIPTKTRFRWTWATNGSDNQVSKPSWIIRIDGQYLRTFRERIGFFSVRRREALDKIIDRHERADRDLQPHWHGRYPDSIKQEYLALIRDVDAEWSRFRRTPGVDSIKPSSNPPTFRHCVEDWRRLSFDNVCLSRTRLNRYWRLLRASSHWRDLGENLRSRLGAFHERYLDPNCYWTTVKSVRKSREPHVTYDVHVPGHHRFVANGLLNHNSGKSTGMTLIISYLLHQLLKLKNPSAFYGIKLGTVLTYTIVAINYGGAKSNVFDPLLSTMAESPWFITMHQILDEAAARLGEEELYRIKDSFVFYKTAGLNVSPSSPSRRSLRGKTRIGYAQDEICHFGEDEKQVNISGMEVWRALSRSMQTIRPAFNRLRRGGRVHVPPGLGVGISSPWSVSDPGMQLRANALKNPRSGMYTVLMPTWEANPLITQEDLQEEFALDPVSAWRDLGCRPPFSENAFVNGIGSFKPVVRREVLPFATQTSRCLRMRGGSVMTVDLHWRKTDRLTPRILALDAGRTFNAFTCAVAHLDERGRLVYDLFVEILPRPETPVSFVHAQANVIDEIVRRMNVVVAVSDRWQAYSINDHMRESLRIEVANRTLKYGDFVAWRDDLLNGRFDVPRPELLPRELLHATGPEVSWLADKPTAQLMRQSIIVVDVPGKTVEKPSEGNDDVFRTAVLAHACANVPEIRTLLTPTAAQARVAGAIGAYASATGGQGILTNAGGTSRPPRRIGVSVVGGAISG